MNHPLESRDAKLKDGTKVSVHIYADDCVDNPNDWGSNGTFSVFEHSGAFWKTANKIFGDFAHEAIEHLHAGEDLHYRGKYYVGLERYRHSGDVYARCGAGNFPDRQWDVSSIVGWWEASDDRPVDQFDSALSVWNQYVSGDVYGIMVEDEDGEQLASLWGIWGYDSLDMYIAELLAEAMLAVYSPDPRQGTLEGIL